MFYPIRELYKIVREYQVDIMPVIWVKTASWWLVMVWVGAPLLLDNALWRDAFTEHVVIGKIFVAKKYLVTPSVFKLQKWFLHQYGEEFNHKSKSEVFIVWPVAGREQEGQKKKMLI